MRLATLMYPILFRLGPVEVSSFGAAMALGAVIGYWLFARELERAGLPKSATDAAIYGLAGGLVGAKLLWVGEHFGEDRFLSLLLTRGGMSWFGGLVGGVVMGGGVLLLRSLPILPALAAATPAFALGHLVGRIGCFMVGDDYGRPSDLPWAVAFPHGVPPTYVPVHPTQLYEAMGLAVLGWFLFRWRRAHVSDDQVLGRYLLISGAMRFAIEFVRVNERVIWGLTVAHLVSLCLVAVGAAMILAERTIANPAGDLGRQPEATVREVR